MKKKRSAKTRFKILVFLIVVALILLFLLFAPLFNIKHIEVKGTERYTTEEIISASGIRIGENGFRKLMIEPKALLELRLLDSEDKIKQLPYVKTSTVSLVFPNRVLIQLTDRQPSAYLVYFDNYLTVDEQGFVLETGHSMPAGGLKEIRGIDFTKYILGGQLEALGISLIRQGVEIINTINISDENSEIKLAEVMDWVDMISENDAMLSLDNRIIVRFNPRDKLQYTIDFTKEIFFKRIGAKETGRIDFSGDQNPSFIPD